jgi:two-component system, NarL family, nitrate/nitrite sensor histidine kinase NarX
MWNRPDLLRNKLIIAQTGCLVVVVGIGYGLWWLAGGITRPIEAHIIYWGVVVAAGGGLVMAVRSWWMSREYTRELETLLQNNQAQTTMLEQQLKGVIRLNELIIDVNDEKELVENALNIIADLSGASGSSYMPFDEWGQPLVVYTQGVLPAPVIKAWTEHLSAPKVRHRCQVCTKLETVAGEACPLLEAPFSDSIRIYCLPLQRGERLVGMLNVYLPIDKIMTSALHDFLEVLVHEMLLAIDMIRLRGQELATLHQLRHAQEHSESLATIIKRLLEGLCDVLEYESARIDFKPAKPHFSGLRLENGQAEWLNSVAADVLIQNTMDLRCIPDGNKAVILTDEVKGRLIAAPCCLPEGAVIGALVLAGEPEWSLQQRHLDLVETVAAQAALLVENERQRLSLEYHTIIQERVRLAREIHDSLAQTLAYLKLTAAQMQSQLANGDMLRLEQSLNHSYQALSEAYLETRTVIDNLRAEPNKNVLIWLEQISWDFKKTTNLEVVCNLSPSELEIRPEIQAQLMRIVQESLSNVRKHAHASKVWLQLRVWNGELILEISDDGVGFSAEDILELARYGLRGMRERAELIGADFQIISQPGGGTTIRLQMPYKTEETTV